ncbi:hypothetical protein B9Z55_006051 [Caenorhabditis nigoni]|uniref:Uncharacterized protein n=1 Tax=Caenorhabditis nigoni TaxID=1611254 RepID=A0A2G5V3H2_9PELO|nr:hypothetical protein B9Z55_006051 [Caenorhabditis nigoni]
MASVKDDEDLSKALGILRFTKFSKFEISAAAVVFWAKIRALPPFGRSWAPFGRILLVFCVNTIVKLLMKMLFDGMDCVSTGMSRQ